MQVLLQRQPWPQLGDGARDSRPLSVPGQPVHAPAHHLCCGPYPGCLSQKCSSGDANYSANAAPRHAVSMLLRNTVLLFDAMPLWPPLAGSWNGGLQLHGVEGGRVEKGSVQAPGVPALIPGHPACHFRKRALGFFISIVFHSVPRVHALNPKIAERRLSW